MATHQSEGFLAPTTARPSHGHRIGGRSWACSEEVQLDDLLRAYYREQATECLNRAMLGRRHGLLE